MVVTLDGGRQVVDNRKLQKLYSVAKMYYTDGMNQIEIAKQLGVSRTSISRMLAEAQENNILQITITPPMLQEKKLAQAVSRRYNISDVIVLSAYSNIRDTSHAVGHAAASRLVELVSPHSSLAISWGRMINHVVQAMPPNSVDGVHVSTLVGSVGGIKPELDGPELARRMAMSLHGTYEYVNAPAVVLSATVRDQLLSSRQIHHVLDNAANADVALFGVGDLDDPGSSLNRAGYITKQQQVLYKAQGGVGHIVARIINANGEQIEEFNRRVISVPLSALKRCPHSMCVAIGGRKAPALNGALLKGYVDHLVIDSLCAEALINF